MFSPVGVTFTGSGFYRNDSRAPVKTAKSETQDRHQDRDQDGDARKQAKAETKKPDLEAQQCNVALMKGFQGVRPRAAT